MIRDFVLREGLQANDITVLNSLTVSGIDVLANDYATYSNLVAIIDARANSNVEIIAGDGLSGGGTLAGPNVTLLVDNTVVRTTGVQTLEDVSITGNLFVYGNTTSISTTNLDVEDALIILNANAVGEPSYDIGILFDRGSNNNSAIFYDSSAGEFVFAYSNSNSEASVLNILNYANAHFNHINVASINVTGSFVANVDGNTSTVLMQRDSVANTAPGSLELGELHVNTFDGELYLRQASDTLDRILRIIPDIPVSNVLYVQKSGSDSNDGQSWSKAFLTIDRAVQEARDSYNGATVLIEIAPGEYTTQGSIEMPANCIIRCAYRTVIIKPESGYEQRNVFLMDNNCFIEGPIFEGWQIDDLDNPTVGFAAAFRPGAVITRAPYVHKITVRTAPTWGTVAPPLDAANANPLVGNGAGVVIADGDVCSPYSVFPNIMTWGATPVSHNGVGYVAKNGALINAVNAISIWAHKHFLALSGGEIILSSCSTQFGDYSLVASGQRITIDPLTQSELSTPHTLTANTTDANTIYAVRSTIIDDLWAELESQGYVANVLNGANDETYTRRDANTFIRALTWTIQTENEQPMLDFAKGLFDTTGNAVFSNDKLDAFTYSFNYMRDYINTTLTIDAPTKRDVSNLVLALNTTISSPNTTVRPSTITAIGHTWTAIRAGVALTKIPPAFNQATIEDSILEQSNGIVIASGQDDQGSAIFVGGMRIDSDTGELSGPPFDKAVQRIATKAAIARSF